MALRELTESERFRLGSFQSKHPFEVWIGDKYHSRYSNVNAAANTANFERRVNKREYVQVIDRYRAALTVGGE